MSPAEAARRLGVSRSRIYALAEQGELDDVSQGGSLRISLASLERRLAAPTPLGQPLSSINAWAVLALSSGDAAFRAHVGARLSDPDRSRAKTRLTQHSLLELLPRLRGRATVRRFAVGAEPLLELLKDVRLLLAGPSAARALGWPLPDGAWPVEAYVPEAALVDLVERYALDPNADGDVVLRSVPEPWPFPPHLRVVPELVATVDLAEAGDVRLTELGTRQLDTFVGVVVADWRQKPSRRRPLRPIVPTGPAIRGVRRERHAGGDDLVWDDRAEQDAEQLVALLFLAALPLRRTEIAETLRISQGRLARACAVLHADPLRGLRLQESGDQLGAGVGARLRRRYRAPSRPGCTGTPL